MSELSQVMVEMLNKFPSQEKIEEMDEEQLEEALSTLHPFLEGPLWDRATTDHKNIIQNAFLLMREQLQIQRVRKDPNAFMEYCFRDDVTGLPIKQGAIHQEWHDVLGKYKQIMILACRGHGKTTTVVGRILWELGRDPNLRIKVVCSTDDKAAERVMEIQSHILNNENIKKVFPNLKPMGGGKWTSRKIFVERDRIMRDPSIDGYGVFSSGTGGRSDIIMFDDVADRKNTLEQPAMRDRVKEAVKGDWLATLSTKGWCVAIATLWHQKDVYHDLGGDNLKTFLKGIEPDQSDLEPGAWFISFSAVGEDFEPVWPEVWPREKLVEKYNQVGRSAFNRGWRQKPIDEDQTVVDPTWIQYYSAGDMPPKESLILIQSYDLAISTRQRDRNSFFTCVTLAADLTEDMPLVYIMDAYQKRIPFPKQVEVIKEGYKRIKPDMVLIETVAYQAALAQHLMDTTMIPIVPIRPGVSKLLRLEACTPQIENGRVLFNRRLDSEENIGVVGRGDLIGQLLEFPLSAADDLVDALSQGVQYIQQHHMALQQFKEIGHHQGRATLLGGEDDRVYDA